MPDPDPFSTSRAKASQPRRPGRPAGAPTGEGRRALLDAARAVMAEKGGPRVTVREVAERAGVQPALVNYYFGGKQGLLRAVIAEVASAGVERIQRATRQSGSARDRVRSLVESWVAGFAEDPYFPRLVAEQVLFGDDEAMTAFVEQFGRPNLAAIAGLLEEGEAQGELRHVEPQYFVPAFAGLCLWFFLAAPVTQRLFHREMTPEHVEGFTRAAADLVLHGISTQPGEPVQGRRPHSQPTRASGSGEASAVDE